MDKQEEASYATRGDCASEGASACSDSEECVSAGASLFVRDFKALVRPLLSCFFAIALIACVFGEIPVPEWFLGIALSYLGGWAVSREVEKRRN